MAISTGKDGDVLIGANSVACIENWSIDESAPVAKVTCMKDAYAAQDAGIPEWSGSIGVVFDPTDTNGQGAFVIGASLSGVFRHVDATTGSPEWTGTIIISGIGTQASPTDYNKQSYTFVGDGALTKGTVA